MTHPKIPLLLAVILLSTACTRTETPNDGATTGAETEAAAPAPTNRIDIPAAVRQNLGITFVSVEARRVEQTLRVPGRFEYLPTARREYRTMLPGRVELLVEQFDRVDAGTPLYRIDSPAWRDVQQKITDAGAAIERHTVRLESFDPLLAAHEHHEQQLGRSIEIWRERVEQLERVADAGGGRQGDLTQARGTLATAQSELAEIEEKHAQLIADKAETASALEAARTSHGFLLDSAAALVHLSVDELLAPAHDTDSSPLWRAITMITVRSEQAGVIETLDLTNGAWATEESSVLTVVQPQRLRFRAVGLQSDLGRLRDGLRARIVAPSPTRADHAIDLAETLAGTLALDLSGDPDGRTIDLLVVPETLTAWARAGVSAQLEIVTDETADPMLAIPSAAVQRDGLVPVIFRRDPKDPNKAIRLEADLGLDDGRWIVVQSGLRRGDEIVLDGAFQLMLATTTTGGQQKGGHFHADGTFHADDEH